MIYKEFSNTGIKISAIAQGTTRMGTCSNFDPEEVKNRIKVIKYGIDLGANYIDTAELYGGGFVEEVVGEIIKGIRDKIFLASKFNPKINVKVSITYSIENSLKRLNTDYLDLYQIHWPNPSIPISEIMEVLSDLIKQGKVRYIGVSNFTLKDFQEAQIFLDYKIVSNQLEYNLLDRSAEDDFLPFCKNNKITMLAYSPLNQGRIIFNDKQREVLLPLVKKYNKTVSQIILRWLIEHDQVIAIVKTKNITRMKENILAAEFNLEEEDILKIENLPRQNFVYIPADKIDLCASADKPVYTSIEEAVENKYDFVISPENLAKIIKEQKIIKPVRLNALKENKGRYSYVIDDYDPADQIKKYWAWIIAYGYDEPVPAFIFN